ncbi:MAG: hypothetical protein LBP59_06150 [Planctomycetaceae bacterium]|jgi:hypothetical protein|nr:hypothetical protein [Planctomycetaceae bacterium]
MRKIFEVILPLLVIVLLVSGCSRNVGVNGKVTFSDDGAPVSTGTVCFVQESGSTLARGDLQPDGTYVIGTMKMSDGLLSGKYNVYLDNTKKQTDTKKTDEIDPITNKPKEIPIYEEQVDPKFHNKETSGLTVEIKGSTRFDFKVDRFNKTEK